jgi:hypothetical protein
MDWAADELGLDFWHGQEIILFSTASRPALGPIHPPIQRLLGTFPPGLKR